jgi:SAM-dependent methyltransferase
MRLGLDPVFGVKLKQKTVLRSLKQNDFQNYKIQKNKLKHLVNKKYLLPFKIIKRSLMSERLVITYPYEWPQEMFFDALLFHIKLLKECIRTKTYLKDALLNNILFKNCKPLFVDFGSFLVNDKVNSFNTTKQEFKKIIITMFFPYALLPSLAFSLGQNSLARSWLSFRFCNTSGEPPNPKELKKQDSDIRWLKAKIFFWLHNLLLNLAPQKTYCNFLHLSFHSFFHPKLTPSNYSAYYKKKKSYLTNAHKSKKYDSVNQILTKLKPRSVLDLGANTGLYSFLAAKKGAQVVALEEDEYCANSIYLAAAKRNLPIHPILSTFKDLNLEICADGRIYNQVKNPALFLPLTKRVKFDCVLCLGLMHHLNLGRGISLQNIFETLARLASPFLVLEVIWLHDALIQNEKEFFPQYCAMHKNYTEKNIYKKLKMHFNILLSCNSDKETRKILLCQKKLK